MWIVGFARPVVYFLHMSRYKDVIKNPFLKRSFRFYCLAFLLPFLVVGLVVTQYTYTSFSEQAAHDQLNDTANALSHLEAWHTTFGSVITQLNYNDSLRNADISQISGMHTLQKILHMLTAAHEGLDHIWYWVPGSTLLLSADDSLTLDRLNHDRFEVEEAMPISDALQAGQVVQAFDRYSASRYLLFPYPCYYTEKADVQKTLVVFQVKEDIFRRELQNLVGERGGSATLYGAGGVPLLTISQNAPQEAPEALTPQPFEPGYEAYSTHSSLLMSRRIVISSRITGSVWTLGLERVSQLTGMLRFQQMLLVLIILVLGLGFFATVVFTYNLYKPISSIRTAISREQMPSEIETDDDYEYIESCLEHIINDNRQLKSIAQRHAQSALSYFSSMFFMGKVRGAEDLSTMYSLCGFAPREAPYHMAQVLCGAEEARRLRAALPAEGDGVSSYVLTHINAHGLLLFCPATFPLPSVAAENIIGVSAPVDALANAPLYCAQAMYACCREDGGEPVRRYVDLPQATLEASIQGAPHAWWSECRDVDRRQQLLALAGHVLRELAQQDSSAIEDPQLFYIPPRAKAQRMEAAAGRLIGLLDTLPEPPEGSHDNLLDEMLQYVAAHYDSPDFSIKQMAQDFSMSISALSSSFKREAGMLLNDHITAMKMEKAMSLLATTELTVGEVGLAVGYYNVNSFIRRFNQINQMTPGEYRNRMRG